jgi:hypothetical protein
MKIKLLFYFLLLSTFSNAKKANVWLTYSNPKFVYAPGIEGNYFFNKYIGVQLGTSVFFENYNKDQVVNAAEYGSFNFLSLNLNAVTHLYEKGEYSIGFTVGARMYYGPHYKLLFESSSNDYEIYFNASDIEVDFGVDLGLTYRYKKISSLFKFDTGRSSFTFGVGYSFGYKEKEVVK